MEEIKKEQKDKFIKKAIESGFTEKQAEFLWIEIQDKVFITSQFGGIF